jgi:Domain of unknown function (DUF4253)
MALLKFISVLFLATSLNACSQMDKQNNSDHAKTLSEKSGIEMIVIDEAEKITNTTATRFVKRLSGSSYIDDPIKSEIRQEFPKSKTVELPGISFLIDNKIIKEKLDTLNKKFAYRNYFAFISDDSYRDDKKQTISIIHSTDKYNALRLQETSGGSYIFSTDSLITKLNILEQKYPFEFIGVGDDWLVIKIKNKPTDWEDAAREILKVCPNDETTIIDFAEALQKENGQTTMWWD